VRLICLPISGIEEAAGGVFSVKSNSSKKNATNIFIPVIRMSKT